MTYQYEKFDGLGNDFIFVDAKYLATFHSLSAIRTWSQKVCNREKNIGADGVVFFHDKRLLIVNSDGSLAATCGNALRAYGYKLLLDGEWDGKKHLNIDRLPLPFLVNKAELKQGEYFVLEEDQTFSELVFGDKNSQIIGVLFAKEKKILKTKLNPSLDDFLRSSFNIDRDPSEARVPVPTPIYVELENPHWIFFSEEFAHFKNEDFTVFGKSAQSGRILNSAVEKNILLSNISMVTLSHSFQTKRQNQFSVTTYERGAGLTKACGSGAIATSLALNFNQLTLNPEQDILIKMPGGQLVVNTKKFVHNEKILLSSQANFISKGTL